MEVEHVGIETLSRQSATFTIKCGWWAGRKILKLVKKYRRLFAFRSEFNEIVIGIRGITDNKTQEIYKLLQQNGAKEIRMTSGLSIL
ncbi:MAG: hypothetical protein WAK17_26325 [Candidatus Nitrosopolaris sp.]|jgi:hypothetical protein